MSFASERAIFSLRRPICVRVCVVLERISGEFTLLARHWTQQQQQQQRTETRIALNPDSANFFLSFSLVRSLARSLFARSQQQEEQDDEFEDEEE